MLLRNKILLCNDLSCYNITKMLYVMTIFRCIDTNDEERDKGKTVEYGKAFFETEKKVSNHNSNYVIVT